MPHYRFVDNGYCLQPNLIDTIRLAYEENLTKTKGKVNRVRFEWTRAPHSGT